MNADLDTLTDPRPRPEALRSSRDALYSASMLTILVFEEDDLIRGLLEEWLVEAGFSVRQAGPTRSPDPSSERDHVALIIVDICQPRYGAAEAICKQKLAYPDAPVIAISGRFRSGLAGSTECARELGVRQVLPKPFTREDLLDAVRSAIAAPAGQ
jgi:DNA-binding NtrC family response regulator